MAKILLITDYYPPRISIATNRMKAFSKYLIEKGHGLVVVTLGNSNLCAEYEGAEVHYCTDNDWLKPSNTNVKENAFKHYAKCAYNIIQSNLFLYSHSWVNKVFNVASKLIEEKRIDIIITSYPTIGTMVAGNKIKKKYPNVKWIADMRDAVWTPNNSYHVREKLKKITEKSMTNIDGLLAVSHVQADGYLKYTPQNITVKVIRNGYDFSIPTIEHKYGDKFKIVYTGNFYGARSPHNFLKALEIIGREQKFDDITFEIIGNNSIVNYNHVLREVVKELPRMPYNDLINYCAQNADLMLVVIPRSREKGVYTGKLFDYIGIGKPILGLVPKGDVAEELIKQAGNGYLAENENIGEIISAVKQAYNDWKEKKLPEIDETVQASCHRRVEIEKLHELIEKLVSE